MYYLKNNLLPSDTVPLTVLHTLLDIILTDTVYMIILAKRMESPFVEQMHRWKYNICRLCKEDKYDYILLVKRDFEKMKVDRDCDQVHIWMFYYYLYRFIHQKMLSKKINKWKVCRYMNNKFICMKRFMHGICLDSISSMQNL